MNTIVSRLSSYHEPIDEAAVTDEELVEALEILLTGAMNASKLVGLKMNVPVASQQQILQILPALKGCNCDADDFALIIHDGSTAASR